MHGKRHSCLVTRWYCTMAEREPTAQSSAHGLERGFHNPLVQPSFLALSVCWRSPQARDREHKAEIQRLKDAHRQEMKEKSNQMETIAAQQVTTLDSGTETLLRGMQATLGHLNETVRDFQQHILPSFEPPADVFGSLQSNQTTEPMGVTDFGATKQLQSLDQSLALLRMVMDAKLETLGLVRSKLKDENSTLKKDLEAVRSELNEATRSSQVAAEDFGKEKEILRQEFAQIQAMYDCQLETLQKKLIASEAHGARSSSTEEMHELQVENAKLRAELEEDRDMRADLAAELVNQRGLSKRLESELASLKIHQKFLGTSETASKVAPEKMDLMRMVNEMLTQNNQLKEEKILLEAEISKVRRETLHSKVDTSIVPTPREIELVASETTSDTDITNRILRAHIDTVVKGPKSNVASLSELAAKQTSSKSSGVPNAGLIGNAGLFKLQSTQLSLA